MKISFDKRYEKRIDAIKSDKLLQEIANVVKCVIQAKSKKNIPNLKKLQGSDKAAYRIRLGNYRIGIHIHGDTVIFSDFAHRKDIYKTFP